MSQHNKQGTTLVLCVLGLYGSFITWSILQEKINTTPYSTGNHGETEFFKAPLVVNMVQSLFAIIISFTYSMTFKGTNAFKIFTDNESSVSWMYFKKFCIISITSSLSAPIGYQSLRHVDYLVYLLSKSCKLIPLMIVHFVFYRTRFPGYKYVVAVSVTSGVVMFTFFDRKKSGKKSANDGQTALGLAQLTVSMVLDGLTNSTQDQLFKLQKQLPTTKHKVDGTTLMCVLNTFMLVLTFTYTAVFKYTEEFSFTYTFVHKYPQVVYDILVFAVFGSVGQIFVFVILEKFDSIILTTATVTRKMLSMVSSVVLFGHRLSWGQVAGIVVVFFGIGYEAALKALPVKAKVA
ncbi:UDP-galactose transporter [Yamadazyma tenuis]|uniref:UDP-galactose transporter homolog 1 n=1 Tax=Candida tenuis (strain ATCC 10573 / BCRC 21748 / CBS 615 / JCM 9827 / NBRC 10315 / NRRL Y-1498 / VKM Y-70) TaxID=590646 RepID=G3BF02_CANTC|nr:UAA transporter [Yamadazyma tenuis ATCC 10573]EGV59977.1 UAA transporter [Yamadazyma tenuis ATCC 10573]WEJ94793.1 UDP-galactose transporter [Yamadazyma tenuis]